LNLRNQYRVPLWMGESGENSNTWFYDCVQLLEDHNIGWCWWTHKKIATTTSPYSAPITGGYQQILDYWNGKAPRPSADFARSALLDEAEHLKLKYCEFRPDVLDALFRKDFGSVAKPYAGHSLPGLLPAAEYDMGRNGVGSLDADYQVTHGLGSESWNRGGEFRNDGVDIEKSRDAAGPKYSVGWIESGEWLQYSVQIAVSGTYRVEARVASESGGGQFSLALDGQQLTQPVRVPRTGGWYTWQTFEVGSVPLPAGEHVLKIDVQTGGFNLNGLQFVLESSSVRDWHGLERVDGGVWFGQNFPNPFNLSTEIPVLVNRQGDLHLDIFDSRGRLLRTLYKGKIQAGYHTFKWNARDQLGHPVPSGRYAYLLRYGGHRKAKWMLMVK
ncbi:MAG TPA: carbohydrate-binding protein, partial [Bacteroidetes bacterium]|nr:carbohydrate-binding protein [Bacteroidota bacterium]